MSGRSKRLSQALCAVLANRQQSVGKIVALLATHSIESLANGRRNGCSHGFSGALRELFRQSMRLRVLDIQSHSYTILPLSCNHSTIAGLGRQEFFGSLRGAVGSRARDYSRRVATARRQRVSDERSNTIACWILATEALEVRISPPSDRLVS